MSKSHATAFSAQFTDVHFPDALLERYIPLELLTQSTLSQTFLLQEKQSEKLIVAKRYETQSAPIEEGIMHLSHEGLPVFIEKIKTDKQTYILREYIDGVSLDQYAGTRLSEDEAVRIVKILCDILAFLHGQTPPVIHRDIKPSNIIIGPETGKVTLIDFEIARRYLHGASGDTEYMGTHRFAPPEQYGFKQTDNRADIYALGVVLCWLLTGEADVSAAANAIHSASLRKIVMRCTAFDPEKRYKSVRYLKRDLKNFDGKAGRRRLTAAISLCAAALLLAAGFAGGRYTDASVPLLDGLFGQNTAIVFDDPVLEQRVRTAMEMLVGDITVAAAKKVTRIDLSSSGPEVPEEQKIKHINALAYFVNLRALDLSWNAVSDIGALAGLKHLETLQLNGNGGIVDFSALAGLTNMKDIMFVGCQLSNKDALACANMVRLESFWVESTQFDDIGIVSAFPRLNRLVLKKCRVRDISPVAKLADLSFINLEGNPVSDLTPLLRLPYLGTAQLSEDMRTLAEKQLSGTRFLVEYD